MSIKELAFHNNAELEKKDQCHICGEGELIWANGCQTCDSCQLQIKCDI